MVRCTATLSSRAWIQTAHPAKIQRQRQQQGAADGGEVHPVAGITFIPDSRSANVVAALAGRGDRLFLADTRGQPA